MLVLFGASLLCFETSVADANQSPGAPAVDVAIAAATEELYTVGSFSGEDWETFARVPDVDFDAAGNLYVVDEGNYRVVVVDRNGSLVRIVGRQGHGPGEFDEPVSAAILADGRLVVYDKYRALELFDAAGLPIGSTTVNPLSGPGGPLLPLGADRLVTTGGFRVTSSPAQPGDRTRDDHLREIEVFALDGSATEVLYRAWASPLPDRVVEERAVNDAAGRPECTIQLEPMQVFPTPLHLGVLPDGRVAVVDSVGYRVKLIDTDGSVTGMIERDIAPEPVTRALERDVRDRLMETLVGSKHPLSGDLLDWCGGEMAVSKSMIENLAFPEEIPVVSGLAVDGDGRLWIERTAPDGSLDGPIDIIAPEGDYLGTLAPDAPRIPDAFGPDGLMAYIETDEWDLPSVRVIRLVTLEAHE